MSFRELGLRFAYETLTDDPVADFYVPVLENAVRYDRIAGFFSSSSLAIAARGIAGLIRNNGRMRIIASPHLNKDDANVLSHTGSLSKSCIDTLIAELDTFRDLAERDHVAALGWMLDKGFLEVRLAVVLSSDDGEIKSDALFHQKIGILEDDCGDKISFSGSINETASGWLTNSEEFKVFKCWEPGQDSYFLEDEDKFLDLWQGTRKHIKVIPAPIAFRDKLVSIGTNFNRDRFVAKQYVSNQKQKTVEERLSLFSYQKAAKQQWMDSSYSLLFEMATGTGKTRTAMACIMEFLNKTERSVVIICTPQGTLSRQWKKEIQGIGLPVQNEIIVDGTNHRWRTELPLMIKRIAAGIAHNLFIYTTHATASADDFRAIIINNSSSLSMCFVGDEAHGLGAPKTKNALLPEYQFRIGLSATPKRWFDDYGTSVLEQYFGGQSYQFTISDALTTVNPITNKTFLVNYRYFPVFTSLNNEEFGEYIKLCNRIKRLARFARGSDEYQTRLESLLFQRANIEKHAANKLNELYDLLCAMNPKMIKNTLIFTSDAQMEDVMTMLADLGIIAHRFTQEQGTSPEQQYGWISEREHIIREFRRGVYQVMVAIKCLDEGIDIPVAETAIIMASSTNPREYVQRIGRVIRQAPNKERSSIYDFTLEPDMSRIDDPDVARFEYGMFKKEFLRIQDMSLNSINNADVYLEISKRMECVRNGCEHNDAE